MIQITNLTAAPKQAFNLVGNEGEIISVFLNFMPTQRAWTFNISCNGVEVDGGVLTCMPNILRNLRNVLSFGIMCGSTDGFDPQYIDDFTTGRVVLNLLNRADVAEVEALVYP